MAITITSCRERQDLSSSNYRCYLVTAKYNGTPFSFITENGNIDYYGAPPCLTAEEEANDAVATAWGEYAKAKDIYLGITRRTAAHAR